MYEDKKDHDLVWEMGQVESALRSSDEGAEAGALDKHADKIFTVLVDRGVLLMDHRDSAGWKLMGATNFVMPGNRDDMVFSKKGFCWIYWASIGKPDGHDMIMYSNPIVAEENSNDSDYYATGNGKGADAKDDGVKSSVTSHLRLVK